MLCNSSLMSEDGFARPCLATITARTNLGIFFILARDYGRRWYDQVYQLPPYSEVVHTLDGHRNMKGFIYLFIFIYLLLFYFLFFIFFAVVALGVLLRIDCLMAAWHTSWPRVWFWLAEGSCFWWKPFQVSRIFQGKTFWFLPSFSHFFIFSLRLVFLTSLVVHFALSLLSFLPNFQVRPLFTLFSFLNFTCILFFWVPFFFLCFPFPFSICVTSFNGELLWN